MVSDADRGEDSSAEVSGQVRCSCTLASLFREIKEFFVIAPLRVLKKLRDVYFTVDESSTHLLSVTNVPVNFLHLLRAISSRSGSSFKNFSSRQTRSISDDKMLRKLSCKLGNRIFSSATVLL